LTHETIIRALSPRQIIPCYGRSRPPHPAPDPGVTAKPPPTGCAALRRTLRRRRALRRRTPRPDPGGATEPPPTGCAALRRTLWRRRALRRRTPRPDPGGATEPPPTGRRALRAEADKKAAAAAAYSWRNLPQTSRELRPVFAHSRSNSGAHAPRSICTLSPSSKHTTLIQ